MADMLKYNHILVVIFLGLMSTWTSSFAGNNSGAAFSTWPDTGQTTCYNNSAIIPCPAEGDFKGQDAQHTGPVRSYTLLNAGAMVQDDITGLIWEMKNNMDGTQDYNNPNDADNTYTWCDPNTSSNGGNAGTCGTNNTMDFIDQLNSGDGFGGHTDWRMPTIKELASLVDLGQSFKAIDPLFAAATQPFDYWSSTTSATFLQNYAWSVSFFFFGWINSNTKPDTLYVRAVRGGQTPNVDRYVDNKDGTITDTVTCLQWQKTTMDTKNGVGPDTYTWQEALAGSENLSLAGHSDWRLPNRNELLSLVDYSRNHSAIDPVFATTTLPSDYWSSSTCDGLPDNARLVDFDSGWGIVDDKSGAYYVRAVRNGECGKFSLLGDVNKDGFVNLSDAVLALQVFTGIVPTDVVAVDNDVNGDGKVGMAEVIYVLRKVANVSN